MPPGPHALQVHRTRTGLGRAVRTAHFGTTGAGYMGMFARQHARRAVLARPLRLEANPKPSHSSPPSLSLLRRAALAPWRSTPFWSDRAAQRPPPPPPVGRRGGPGWPPRPKSPSLICGFGHPQVHFLYRTYTPIVLLAARRLPASSTLRSVLLQRGSTSHACACALLDNVP